MAKQQVVVHTNDVAFPFKADSWNVQEDGTLVLLDATNVVAQFANKSWDLVEMVHKAKA